MPMRFGDEWLLSPRNGLPQLWRPARRWRVRRPGGVAGHARSEWFGRRDTFDILWRTSKKSTDSTAYPWKMRLSGSKPWILLAVILHSYGTSPVWIGKSLPWQIVQLPHASNATIILWMKIHTDIVTLVSTISGFWFSISKFGRAGDARIVGKICGKPFFLHHGFQTESLHTGLRQRQRFFLGHLTFRAVRGVVHGFSICYQRHWSMLATISGNGLGAKHVQSVSHRGTVCWEEWSPFSLWRVENCVGSEQWTCNPKNLRMQDIFTIAGDRSGHQVVQ